jgi:eukaryotic-like serine/threonine-protein kinase
MGNQPPSPASRLAFGPFEVDASASELLKGGVRVRLPSQPFLILMTLLEHPGEVVTREQLSERLWSEDTFVDFEHGLNAAMNKLRRALSDSAEQPRYIETVPGRGYRFIGTLEHRVPASVTSANGSSVRDEKPVRRRALWWWLPITAACLAVSLGLWWRLHGGPDTLPSGKLTRLTTDAGISDFPALSPDGKLVAYSSDRIQEGQRDLYVQQVAGGEPIRLTFDGAGNRMPDFSPDGSRVVFRSDRDGGGIYEIPAFGGTARLLAREGLNPKFSPDGSQVAYWVGAEGVAVSVPGSGAVWVLPLAGGQPRRVGPNLTHARFPIWSPDGKHLLVAGYSAAKAHDLSFLDWWLVPADGGQGIKTGFFDALVRNKLARGSAGLTFPDSMPGPGCWLAASNSIIFAAETGTDTQNLFETQVSPAKGQASGLFKRLTAGPGNDSFPSCAVTGVMAFAKLEQHADVWSMPFDLNRTRAKGALERLTQGPARRQYPSLSGDGEYIVFSSTQSGRLSIWLRELATGKESPVAPSPLLQRYPVIDAAGSRVAFSVYENEKRSVYMAAPGGAPEKLCEGCLRATDWSPDGKSVLIFGGGPYRIDVLDVDSRQQTPLLRHSTYSLLYGHFSPDGRWISFTARVKANRGWIMIAPLGGPKPVPESAWIKIAEESAEDWGDWSPDGNTLYFTSERDGHTCLWAQRIGGLSRMPAGEAFAALHLHGRAAYRNQGWSGAGQRITMSLSETTGNIWLMSQSGER